MIFPTAFLYFILTTMSVTYSLLCEEFLSIARRKIDDGTLKKIKEYYTNCIGSNRKFSYIKDLNALLSVLEKRDVLSSDNIIPLYYISKNFIHDTHLENKLKDYEDNLQSVPYSSIYKMYEDENEYVNNDNAELPKPSTSLKNESRLEQMVLSQVSKRIGNSWRDVARHLGILESEIDAIQNKYPFNLKEQSYQALKHYISQYNEDRWKLNLMRALEKGRRKDLKEIVEELIVNDFRWNT